MTKAILLDVTRALLRRWRGLTPSGIDRVCDAYAAHFAHDALAVVQIAGRPLVFDRASSRKLFAAFGLIGPDFRREVLPIAMLLPRSLARREDIAGGRYINVSHTDFDLGRHWRWVSRNGLRTIYFIHDLIPITHCEVTTAHKTRRHRGRVERALSGADAILVNSYDTADELRSYARSIKCRPPQIAVAQLSGSSLPLPLRPARQDDNFFVSVGTIELRKNHRLLLEVWSRLVARLGEQAPRLVIAGNSGLGGQEVFDVLAKRPELNNHVEIRSGLDDGQIANLVSGARAVLLPSFAEGFGLPLIEALGLRVPVIASDLASFREIGGGIPTLLNPADAHAWEEAVLDMMRSGGDYRRQLAMIPHFRAPSWVEHFALVDDWLADETGAKTCAPDENGIYTSFPQRRRQGLEN